jgi:Beta-ketoacyl synthase, N-terminal domain
LQPHSRAGGVMVVRHMLHASGGTAPSGALRVTQLSACVRGIGLLGPGLDDWLSGASVLTGVTPYTPRPTVLPVPAALPAAERRRTGAVVRLALAIGFEASSRAGANPAELPTVFSSSGGDGSNCHEICQTLATGDRQLSPTRFHNSVHNAASGYWSIAVGATPASSVLCAYDATFGAALLEALTQIVVDRAPVLLVAYDSGYPEPLHGVRPIPDAFGVAMVLAPVSAHMSAPAAHASSDAREAPAPFIISAALTDASADLMADAQLEVLRATIPAARCLPLLSKLARQEHGRVVIDYLEEQRIAIEVSPWR